MAVEKRSRVLAWEGCYNARDLGGYPTVDGKETRWGAVVRCDNPALLTEAGRASVVEHGVRTIVDLRLPDEVRQHPNPFTQPGPHGISYTNISFIDPAAGEPASETIAKEYSVMLGQFQPQVGEAMKAVARAPEGGVMVHCMGGKDRTGLIAALLLDLAGVPREIIGQDYALTAECLRPLDEKYLEHGPGTREEREALVAKYMPTREVMLEVLTDLDERFGGVEAYLRGAGLTAEDLTHLRERLVAS